MYAPHRQPGSRDCQVWYCSTIPEANRLSPQEAFPIFLPMIGSFRQVRAENQEKATSAVLNFSKHKREIPLYTMSSFHLKSTKREGPGGWLSG